MHSVLQTTSCIPHLLQHTYWLLFLCLLYSNLAGHWHELEKGVMGLSLSSCNPPTKFHAQFICKSWIDDDDPSHDSVPCVFSQVLTIGHILSLNSILTLKYSLHVGWRNNLNWGGWWWGGELGFFFFGVEFPAAQEIAVSSLTACNKNLARIQCSFIAVPHIQRLSDRDVAICQIIKKLKTAARSQEHWNQVALDCSQTTQ